MMKGLKYLAMVGLGLGLAGCESDTSREIILDEINIEGGANVKLIQNVRNMNPDLYRVEIYDSKGELRAIFDAETSLGDDTMLLHSDGRKYEVDGGKSGFVIQPESKK